MFCTQCGKPIIETAKFCTECGLPLPVRLNPAPDVRTTSSSNGNQKFLRIFKITFGYSAAIWFALGSYRYFDLQFADAFLKNFGCFLIIFMIFLPIISIVFGFMYLHSKNDKKI